jgi:EAL domain-containing protein (putative c-di-GMP-specific phosphodiesterase class I)
MTDIKIQRDRFLAFAFASADLLVEIDASQKVVFASGAANKFYGVTAGELVGKNWLDLVHKSDKSMLNNLRNESTFGKRCGPILFNLPEESQKQNALITAIKLPDYPDNFYFTVTEASISNARFADNKRTEIRGELLDKESFAIAALESISTASIIGKELDMTFLDIKGTDQLKNSLDEDNWAQFKDQLSSLLKGASVDGQTASELEDGRFGLVHEKGVDVDDLKGKIKNASLDSDPQGHGIDIESQTLETDEEGLSENEFAKALVYTITKFAENGNDLTLGTINEGFEDFLQENAERITQTKQIINKHQCDLVFQPIISLATNVAHHYECLVRFEKNVSPFETITFCEDVGLITELDLMVCSKALNYVLYNMKEDKNTALAVNISGVSIQNEAFVKALREKFKPYLKKNKIADRISFEITESSEIKNLDQVNHFVKELQEDGFEVWLDDFGAGSASFQYLQKLHIDGVKIDGQYVDNVISSDRDGKLIKNLVSLCKDLNMKTIAERVETVEQARFLKSIHVDYGQGYLFAKPDIRPEYISKAKLF